MSEEYDNMVDKHKSDKTSTHPLRCVHILPTEVYKILENNQSKVYSAQHRACVLSHKQENQANALNIEYLRNSAAFQSVYLGWGRSPVCLIFRGVRRHKRCNYYTTMYLLHKPKFNLVMDMKVLLAHTFIGDPYKGFSATIEMKNEL